jgi:hypothetical protein
VTTTEPAVQAPTPSREGRPRRWMVVLTAAWILVLVVAGFFAARRGDPTARDQTTVVQARPHVDEAVGRVAEAALADGQSVVAVTGFEKVGDCDVSVFRGGERYRRGLTAVVTPGTESAFLERIGAALPSSYQVSVRTGEAPRLVADAGFWVTLSGTVVGPGEVRFYADTGDCRVAGDGLSTVDPPFAAGLGPISSTMDRLGLKANDITQAAVPCPSGGTLRTVSAVAPAFTGALDARLDGLPSAQPVVAAPKVYAYRSGGTGVAVRERDEAVLVTATTPCG